MKAAALKYVEECPGWSKEAWSFHRDFREKPCHLKTHLQYFFDGQLYYWIWDMNLMRRMYHVNNVVFIMISIWLVEFQPSIRKKTIKWIGIGLTVDFVFEFLAEGTSPSWQTPRDIRELLRWASLWTSLGTTMWSLLRVSWWEGFWEIYIGSPELTTRWLFRVILLLVAV